MKSTSASDRNEEFFNEVISPELDQIRERVSNMTNAELDQIRPTFATGDGDLGTAGGSRLPSETEGCSRSDKAAAFKTYVCRYYHRGSWWSLDIQATDTDDAEARVAKLGALQLCGELKATIPAHCGSLFPRAICAVRNWLWK